MPNPTDPDGPWWHLSAEDDSDATDSSQDRSVPVRPPGRPPPATGLTGLPGLDEGGVFPMVRVRGRGVKSVKRPGMGHRRTTRTLGQSLNHSLFSLSWGGTKNTKKRKTVRKKVPFGVFASKRKQLRFSTFLSFRSFQAAVWIRGEGMTQDWKKVVPNGKKCQKCCGIEV